MILHRVNDPPNECVPHLSLVPVQGMIRILLEKEGTRDSAEVSDDEQRQPPKTVASTSKENDHTPPNPPSPSNRNSDTGSPTAVIEYEDTQNPIDLIRRKCSGDSISQNGEKSC